MSIWRYRAEEAFGNFLRGRHREGRRAPDIVRVHDEYDGPRDHWRMTAEFRGGIYLQWVASGHEVERDGRPPHPDYIGVYRDMRQRELGRFPPAPPDAIEFMERVEMRGGWSRLTGWLGRSRAEMRTASEALQAAMEGRDGGATFGADEAATSNAVPPERLQATLTAADLGRMAETARMIEQQLEAVNRLSALRAQEWQGRQQLNALQQMEQMRRAEAMARYQVEMANVQQRYARMAGDAGASCPCSSCVAERRLRGAPGQPPDESAFLQQAEALYRDRARRIYDATTPEHARSLILLKEWLSPEQLARFEQDWAFEVIGSKTSRRYRINYGVQANIFEIGDDGRTVRLWCFGPEGDASRWVGDVMLAQKLALETDEEGAIGVANLLGGNASPEGLAPRPAPEQRARVVNPFMTPPGLGLGLTGQHPLF